MTKEEKMKIGYSKIHQHLIRNYGKATMCEAKDCPGECKKYERALRKGRAYSYDINDYFQLCASCHRKYDETDERRSKLSKANKGRCFHGRERRLRQKDLDGNVVAIYNSITEASKQSGIVRTTISNALWRGTKNSLGYIWEYADNKK